MRGEWTVRKSRLGTSGGLNFGKIQGGIAAKV
jgi:hypothetical protein